MSSKASLFTALYEAYHEPLKQFCITKGVREENIDDIVSEAFARALARTETLSALEPPQQRAWLYSAVMRIIREYRAKRPILPFSEIENIENHIQQNDALLHFQTEELFRQYVTQVYAALNKKERALFVLIFDKKADYTALSKEFGYSPAVMRAVVSRFRRKLRGIVRKVLNG